MRVYPVYTVVAEKFEAIVALGVRNTRMKDFHDLWFLSRRFDLDGATLNRAFAATFIRRGTSFAGELLPFTAAFVDDADRQAQWRAFLARNALVGPPEDFAAVIAELRRFVVPALQPTQQCWRASQGWS